MQLVVLKSESIRDTKTSKSLADFPIQLVQVAIEQSTTSQWETYNASFIETDDLEVGQAISGSN